jgi:hypothetical protein
MAVVGEHVLLANWYRSGIAVVDLSSGTVRRRPSAEMVLIVPSEDRPLLVSGRTGGVWQVDLGSMAVAKVLETPPAVDAVWIPRAGRLWLIEGIRASVATSGDGVTTVERGAGGRVLRGYPLGAEGEPFELEVPDAAQRISTDGERLWLVSDTGILIVDPLDGTAMSCNLPPDVLVVAVEPVTRTVMVAAPDDGTSTPIRCLEIRAS